jgi:hypothetical protein
MSTNTTGLPLTFFLHAHAEALVEATLLARVSGEFVDVAVARLFAGVDEVFLYSALEESLAAFAREDRVVVA